MKKYVLMRILRSLFSLFMVTTLIYTIIYTMVPRRKIFEKDPTYVKVAKDPDSRADYVNTVFEKMGYIDYLNSKELHEAAEEEYGSTTTDPATSNKKMYEKYIAKYIDDADFAVMRGGKNRMAIDAISAYLTTKLLAERFDGDAALPKPERNAIDLDEE